MVIDDADYALLETVVPFDLSINMIALGHTASVAVEGYEPFADYTVVNGVSEVVREDLLDVSKIDTVSAFMETCKQKHPDRCRLIITD